MIPKDKRSYFKITIVLTFSCWWCSLPRGGWRGTPPRPWTLAAEVGRGRVRGPWGSRRQGRPPTGAARPGRQTGDTRRCVLVWASWGAPGGRGQGAALEGAAVEPGSCQGRRRSPLLTSRPEREECGEPLCARPLRLLCRGQALPYTLARSTNNPGKHDPISPDYQ